MDRKSTWGIVKQTFSEYSEDNVPRLAAALAYYTIFALAPLLVIAIAVAGFAFDGEAARNEVYRQARGLVGDTGAAAIQTMVEQAGKRESGVMATIIATVVLIFGATGVFGELQNALNTIWEVKPKPQGFWGILRQRFLSFAMVMGMAFLLTVSLVISAALSVMMRFVGEGIIGQIVNQIVSLVVFTGIFAVTFKVLPDAKVKWKDVWIGAAITAVLFTVGKFLIGLYIARGTVASVFGAAGSLVALLVWIYYSAQILFIGAEFTQVYAKRFGAGIQPSENAEPMTVEARAQQGLRSKQPGWRGSEQASQPAGAQNRGVGSEGERYPSVPASMRMALAPGYRPSGGGGSKLWPLLAGVALGKLLLGGKKRPAAHGTLTTGHRLAVGRLFEPGYVTRRRHLELQTPHWRKLARDVRHRLAEGYDRVRDRLADCVR